jgi:SAM-dependent methyltransferase
VSATTRSAAGVPDFTIVTEHGGEAVSAGQMARLHQRYGWAGSYCHDKDVLEAACGTGPGLGYLNAVSRRLVAGDLSAAVLAVAQQHYGTRIDLRPFDACSVPFDDASFDVVILFEALYYLPDIERFFTEAHRLLRPRGVLLLATANKDLFDFNPSPFSHRYYNPPELAALLATAGFTSEFFGGSPISPPGFSSTVFRLAKKIAVACHLIPRSMRGKRLLKRLVFGRLVRMPRELTPDQVKFEPPVPTAAQRPDRIHQVLYCAATKA